MTGLEVMSMKKVGICGYYGEGPDFQGGQPVKVKMIISELEKVFGANNIQAISTHNWRKKTIHLMKECFMLTKKCENIIMLPAVNGVKVFVPLFLLFNCLFHRKIHYIVIGGWLPDLLIKNRILCYLMKMIEGIYVETHVMERALKVVGIDNVFYMPNSKRLHYVENTEQKIASSGLYRFCTFSRIVKEKGIEDAINAVISVNAQTKNVICTLDIYGPLYKVYADEFQAIMANVPDYIVYKGFVPPTKSVIILQDYYMQLFPTKCKTEGFPGSIIDSYFAGLPVLASKWESFNDVVENGKTGIGFEFGDYEDLVSKLKWCIDNPNEIYKMRFECLRKAIEYSPENVIGEFVTHLQ